MNLKKEEILYFRKLAIEEYGKEKSTKKSVNKINIQGSWFKSNKSITKELSDEEKQQL